MKYFTQQNWMYVNEDNDKRPRITKIVLHTIFWFFILTTVTTQFPLGTVGTGQRGVRLRFNAPTGDTVQEGLYIRIPFIERVVKIDVQTQKHEVHALAYSKDIQTVDSVIALNYHLNPDTVVDLYREVGIAFETKIIDPAIQESVKAATAKFTAQELIEQRPIVKDDIKSHLEERLRGRDITVEEFSIVNFDFSDAYEQAVEAKQVAQQQALTEKNKLEQVKFQAEQRVAAATAEAEAIKIQAQAITQQGGKDYVSLKWIEAWKEGGAKVPQFITNDKGGNFLFNMGQ